MIEFCGQLSGTAKKRYLKRAADLGQCFVLGGAAIVSPVLIRPSIRTGNPLIPGAFLIFIVLILLMMRIPKSIHERSKISPKRIYTEEGQIVCVAENMWSTGT